MLKKYLQKIKNSNDGFTLSEILIYVAIFMLMAGALISFVLTIVDIHTKSYVIQEVDANARMVMEVLSDRIRSSSGVTEDSSVFDSDPGVLVLTMDDPAKDPTVFELNADDGTLQITEGTGSAVNLTGSKVRVANLVFKNLSLPDLRNNIGIEITLEYNDTAGNRDYIYSNTLQTSVTLRK